MVGRRPTTDLTNGAELGCSEENESGSGGYHQVIYSVGVMNIGSVAEIGTRPPFGHGPHTPAARDQTAAVRQFGPPAQFSSPKHYKSPQDTLLSHFHFLHYTPILHRLEDEWWGFGPPL